MTIKVVVAGSGHWRWRHLHPSASLFFEVRKGMHKWMPCHYQSIWVITSFTGKIHTFQLLLQYERCSTTMTRNFLRCFWQLPAILFWHSLVPPTPVVHCANAAFDCDLQRTYSSVILPPLWGTTYASRHHRCAQSSGRALEPICHKTREESL